MGIIKSYSRFCVAAAIAGITGLFSYCSLVDPDLGARTGTIAIRIAFTHSNPDISFDAAIRNSIDSVEIIVTHGGGSTSKKFAYADKQARLTDIQAGSVTVLANAYDAAKVVIVTGQTQVQVTAGQSSNADVQVAPARQNDPYLLKPVKTGTNQIELNWIVWSGNSESGTYKQFVIERTVNSTNWDEVGMTADAISRSLIDNANLATGTYTYRLTVIKMDNSRKQFNTQSIEVTGQTSSLTPALSIPTMTGGNVSLTWSFPQTEESRITGFTISRTTDNGATWQTIGNVASSNRNFSDSSPIAGIINGYQVISYEGATPHPSERKDISVPGGSSTPVLSTPVLNGSSVSLSWTFPQAQESRITGFTVQRTTDNGASWQTIGNNISASTRNFADPSPVAGIVNGYQVSSNEGATVHSSARMDISVPSVTTDSLIPVLNTPTLNETAVDLQWSFPIQKESSISGFVIRRTTDNGASWQDLGNRMPSDRNFKDVSPVASINNRYEVGAIDMSAMRHYSAQMDIQVPAVGPTVNFFQGPHTSLANALQTANYEMWVATDPTNPSAGGNFSAQVNVNALKDTTLILQTGSVNTIIIHDKIDATKFFVFIGEASNSSLVMLYNSRPVATPFSKAGFVPYTGTLDAVKHILATNGGKVYVNNTSGTGVVEWVDSTTVNELTITRLSLNVSVITVTDNRNFIGTKYVVFGQSQDPNQLMTVTSMSVNMPSVMKVSDFQSLP